MADTVRPSPELEAIARRWTRAVQSRDGATLRNLVSDNEYLTFVGSSDNEFWTGQKVRDGLEAHFLELPTFTFEEGHVEAFEIGNAGWAFYTFRIQFADRAEPSTGRTTLVFAMADGNWRIIHRHSSFPRPNVDVQGAEMHALQDLMKAVSADDMVPGQTGIAAVLFTDIAGSSTLAETLGDRLWTRVIREHLDQVRATIEDGGGTLVKSLGDGSMSTFPSAAAAMATARAIQKIVSSAQDEPRLQVRIGIHTGDVVQAGDDFFGTVVNKAARIAATARPGEIRVSDATRIMVGGAADFSFDDLSMVSLKGLEGEHRLFRLDWAGD